MGCALFVAQDGFGLGLVMPSGVLYRPSMPSRSHGAAGAGVRFRPLEQNRLEVAPSMMTLIRRVFQVNPTTVRKYKLRGEAQIRGIVSSCGEGERAAR